jgi:hypothetical protein
MLELYDKICHQFCIYPLVSLTFALSHTNLTATLTRPVYGDSSIPQAAKGEDLEMSSERFTQRTKHL